MLQKTQPRTQDNLSVEHYVEEYCELCNLGFNDVALKDIFLWGSWWNHCFLDAGQHISLYIYSVYSISLALKLSGWPFTVGEVKEDFSAYPTVDTILAIPMPESPHIMATQDSPWGAILYVPSLTSHGLHGSQVWRPCTAETGGPTFSDRKSCDPRGHPIVLGASHSHHHFSVCVWAAHIFPDMAVSTTTPSEKSVCSVTVHVTATETVHKISAHPIVPCSVMPVQPWAWRPPLNSPGSLSHCFHPGHMIRRFLPGPSPCCLCLGSMLGLLHPGPWPCRLCLGSMLCRLCHGPWLCRFRLRSMLRQLHPGSWPCHLRLGSMLSRLHPGPWPCRLHLGFIHHRLSPGLWPCHLLGSVLCHGLVLCSTVQIHLCYTV